MTEPSIKMGRYIAIMSPPYQHAKYRHDQRLHQRTQIINGVIDRRFVVVSDFTQHIIERA